MFKALSNDNTNHRHHDHHLDMTLDVQGVKQWYNQPSLSSWSPPQYDLIGVAEALPNDQYIRPSSSSGSPSRYMTLGLAVAEVLINDTPDYVIIRITTSIWP